MTTVSGQQVSDYMHRQLEVVPQDATAVAAAARMRERSIGSVLIETVDRPQNDCRITGIVTETDLVGKVLAQRRVPASSTMADIMSCPLVTIAPNRPMLDASHLMETKKIRHLAVAEGNDVLGIISVRDLVRHFVEAEGGPVEALTDVYRPLSVLMNRAIETVTSDETALTSAQRMMEKHIGALFVTEADELVGIVTEADLVRKLLASQLDPETTLVGALMNSPLIDIDINRTIRDASDLMAAKRVRHLAVTENEKVLGVLSIRDLVKMVSIRDRPAFLRRT
ncbi:MAG: CBS domain protein [Nitrospira sp.]|jgi:CBS domain-containing protein|nr:MAG: CBS domain protein [Nitrospira sp.]